MGIEQTRKHLMQAQKVYFKYLSSQKMARTKSTVKRRAEAGTKAIPQPQPFQTKPSTSEVGNTP